ncbi:unnamed protein product [Dicrocoelium dendriticum]|nr:unnamed protein product [Dicrocoelium dendriticum]
MDGTRKKLMVDDSQSVAELMRLICAKMGIYNHDEYSLVREREETDRDRGLTLRRTTVGTGTVGRDQEKMEKLKRKLHTDDDMDWLNPSQSLRQQGIEEDDILLLKRRYFFSDMNVDARDPVQLNLLYVQLKDAILKGTHPVSLEEAVHLAAIQCQVQFGDYVAERFRLNFLDLKDFLPKEYARIRSLEKKIFQQHAEFAGLSEIEAKVKYCQFCRSLKTYGITFFLVKERIKGKNKLIPRLLGVTKDSVIRLDEKTKEVLKIWPLTSISRWAASLHAFTMDFGEYSPDDCYTAQTSEGEQISQLIGGYVDIITKKQKAKDHPGLQGDEESAMYEENVRAERATIIQHQHLPSSRARGKDALLNGVADGVVLDGTEDLIHMTSGVTQTNGWSQHRLVADTSEIIDSGPMNTAMARVGRQVSPDDFMIGGTHIFHYQKMSPAQRSLLHTINEDMETLQAAKEQLNLESTEDRSLLGVGSDEASKRWLSESIGASQAKVTDEMGAMNTAVAQALRSANRAETFESGTSGQSALGLSADPGDDLMMMQQSFRVVTIHFPAFVDDVKRVAFLRREADAVRADRTGEPVVRECAAESTQNLLSAARNVADAFTNLLDSARPLATGQTREEIVDSMDNGTAPSSVAVTTAVGPVSSASRKAIIEAASRVGEASNDLLCHVMHGAGDEDQDSTLLVLTEEERLFKDQLLGLAKAVANTTAGLVVKAKNLATQPALDPEAQQRVIAAATQTGLCTSQLVACTKVLAPTIHQPSCQQQLCEAAREVSWAVDGIVQASRAAGLTASEQSAHIQQQDVQDAILDTETAATEVRDALDQLNAHLLKASPKAYSGDALDNFQLAYDSLQQCHNQDGQRMVASARRLAQATAQTIADIKAQAELATDDPDRQNRLFSAAKQLADATTVLIGAAKACSANPDNSALQGDLRVAAENLNSVAYSATAELMHSRLIRSLQTSARAAVTGATQLVNVSQVAAKQCRGNSYHVTMDGKILNDLIPRTVISIRESRVYPDDPMTQMALIEACERFVSPCEALVRSSRSIAPTVTDPTTQAALENTTARLSSDVEVLRLCLARLAPLLRHLQFEGALARLSNLSSKATVIETSLRRGTLVPLPDEKVEDCFNLLNTSVHDATVSANELQSMISGLVRMDSDMGGSFDACGMSAVSLASAMAGLVQATRGIVAHEGTTRTTTDDRTTAFIPVVESTRLAVTQDTREAVQLAYELVKAASDSRSACDSDPSLSLPTVLSHSEQLHAQLLDALSRCLRGLPGHREIGEATHLIGERRERLVQLSHSAPTRTVQWVEPEMYEQTQSDLTRGAVEFNQATGDLMSSYSPGAFRRTTKRFTGAYDYLTEKGIELSEIAPIPPDNHRPEFTPVNQGLLDGLVEVSDQSNALMTEAGRVCAHPEQQSTRDRFQMAARDVTESISQLLTFCTSAVTPEQRECELAFKRLDALRPLLENPNRPLSSQTYCECVDEVAKSLSPLADSLRGMSNAAKEKYGQEFGISVRQFATSMCRLIEETAQAAYLIGLADPRSEPGRSSIIDTQLLLRTQNDIQQACNGICDPSVNSRQIVALSTEMARSAKVLCEACSTVSTQTTNPEARQKLNALTRETMQAITALIQHRGSVAPNGEWAEASRQTTLANAQTVSSSVGRLVHLVTQSPQFAGQVARITDEAKEAQRPVCSAGLTGLNAAQTVLRAAQTLNTSGRSGRSESAFFTFSSASKELSESIKALAAAMRSHAPGQRECQHVLDTVAQLMQDIQRAKMASIEDRFQPHRELSEEGFQKQLAASARALLDSAPTLGRAARSEAEQLAHAARVIDSYLPGLTSSAIAAASRSSLPSTQLVYLEHTSAVLEAVDQLITVAKDAGGNPRAVHVHSALDEAVRSLMDSCEDLLTALDDIASRQGHVSTLMDTLNRSMSRTDDVVQVPDDARFSDYHSRLIRIARHMEQLNQVIQLRARQQLSEGELTPLAHSLTQEFQEMCQASKGAAATMHNARKADDLRAVVKAVGTATANLIQATAASRPFGGESQQMPLSQDRGVAELDKRAECLNAKLRELLALLDVLGPNTQACLQSANTVSGIIADLDTTILFASSGTLHPPIHDDVDAVMGPEGYRMPRAFAGAGEALTLHAARLDTSSAADYSSDGFGTVRGSIVRTAKALVDDTQSLVSGTGEDQARLASTAHVAVERVAQLADVVKKGASLIGPGQPDTQVELLLACRDVACGVRDTLQSTSQTTVGAPTDPVHEEVRANVQTTLSNIEALLNKVKNVEDDERRGVQALASAARYCREQATQLNQPLDPDSLLTPLSSRKSVPSVASVSAVSGSSSLIARYLAPDDLARAASGPLQNAVSKVILAGNTQTQRDMLNAAATARDVVTDLICATKALLRYSEATAETKTACTAASRGLAEGFAVLLDELLAVILPERKSTSHSSIADAARRVADLSHTLLNLLDKLRDGPRLVMYFRASSPEWRDVAEKFIGRHVAYHHHYASAYTIAGPGSTRSAYFRPTCFPLPIHQNVPDSSGPEGVNDESEARISAAVQQLESAMVEDLGEDRMSLLRFAHSTASATLGLIRMVRSVGLAPPSEAADRVRQAVGSNHRSTTSASLWRNELAVSMATQDLCHLAQLYSDTLHGERSRTVSADLFATAARLDPSREHLLGAVRRVAAASAQLLTSVSTRKFARTAGDVQNLQAAAQAVKEATDKLSAYVQHDQFTWVASDPHLTSSLSPTLQNVITTQTMIRSRQSELEELQKQLAHLHEEQVRTHPDLFGEL